MLSKAASSMSAVMQLLSYSCRGFADDDALENGAVGGNSFTSSPSTTADSAPLLQLSARVEYTSMVRDRSQDVFGLLSVEAVEAKSDALPERQATDIVCALDVSGSMGGEKIWHLQEAVRFVISQATAQDRLSLVAFNNGATRVLPLRRMTEAGRSEANQAVNELLAGGGTSIAAGLGTALQVLEQRRQRNQVSAVLLLTDGQDGSTRQRVPALVAQAARLGTSIYCFGFGVDHDAALLGDIAEQARTPFTFVENTECIREAFAGAVGGLSSIVAQQVELVLTCRHPVKAVHTPFAVARSQSPAGGSTMVTVTIPDIFAGERRDVLVELAFAAGFAGVEAGEPVALLDAHLRYKDLKTGRLVQSETERMQTREASAEQPEVEPDEEVTAQRERVQVTNAMQEAAAHGDRGDFEAAQNVLQTAGARLKQDGRSYQPGSKVSTMREALDLELADAQQRMTSRSAWEHGGRAELKDAVQMYSVQRCTNTFASAAAPCKKSKAMFASKMQCSMIQQASSY